LKRRPNSPSPATRPRLPRSRWDSIVKAATIEFREKGYEGASIRDIADHVGLLKGSLYNYISGKADLFLAVVKPPSSELISAVEELEQSDVSVADALHRLILLQVDIFHRHYPAPFVYLAHVQSHIHPEFAEWDARYLRAVRQVLLRGLERGEVRNDVNIDVAVRTITGSLAWMMAWYKPRDPESDAVIVDTITKILSDGLAAPAGSPQRPSGSLKSWPGREL
jgi:AcrR family transcriptional regulator